MTGRHHHNYWNSCLFCFEDRSVDPRPNWVETEFSKHNLHEILVKRIFIFNTVIIFITMTSLIAAYITHLLFRSDNKNLGNGRGFRAILQCFNPNITGKSNVQANRIFKLHIKITRILSAMYLMATCEENQASWYDDMSEGGRKRENEMWCMVEAVSEEDTTNS